MTTEACVRRLLHVLEQKKVLTEEEEIELIEQLDYRPY